MPLEGLVRPPRGSEVPAGLGISPKASGTGIGAYLSRQRRLRDIALSELADQTRIPIRSLERLEGGAFDATADGFARGFVRTVAEGLGLDADDAVSRMLAEPEKPGRGARRLPTSLGRRAALALGGIAALFLAVLAGQAALDWFATDPAKTVLRRDPVRSLYAEQIVGSGDPQQIGEPRDSHARLPSLAESRR